MDIFGISITTRPYQKRVLPFMFLMLTIVSIWQALTSSNFFENERLGPSLIPAEKQLIRTGPYRVTIVNEAHKSGIRFTSDSLPEYFETWSTFGHRESQIRNSISNGDITSAYIWISNNNPIRKVWKIDTNDDEILSFKMALIYYKIQSESAPRFMLLISALMAVLFFTTMIKVTRKSIS